MATKTKTTNKSTTAKNHAHFFISKINSPYQEINYIIKNNDSVERILKKFQIKTKEIQIITKNLKSKKLTNIYAGRELTLIIKKTENLLKIFVGSKI